MGENGERTAVIFDRRRLWLDVFEKLLGRIGIAVVGSTADADEALTLIGNRRPDILMAGVDPFASADLTFVSEAKQRHPGLRPVVLAESSRLDAIAAAFSAGAVVYCVTTGGPEDLMSAIRQALEPSVFVLAADLAGAAQAARAREESVVAGRAHGLTRREVEILRLVAEGHTNAQVGTQLWVTQRTVKFHLSNIYRKLGVANRTEASRWALLHGVLDAEITGAGAPPADPAVIEVP